MKFLTLLRGVNVGGKNLISKEELRQTFEGLGFENVRTYIQSGNILFRGDRTGSKQLAGTIEEYMAARFSFPTRAAVFSYDEYTSAVRSAPDGWGKGDRRKHNALFTLGDVTSEDVLAQLPTPKRRIESLSPGPRVVFWSVSKEHLTKTTYMKLPSASVYQHVTVRNHNTVFRLLELFDEI